MKQCQMTATDKSFTFSLANENDSFSFATRIAPLIKAGDVIALWGDLGAGKTTFSRGLIRALLNEPEIDVQSPTFTLVQTYEGPNFPVWHYDMYRIEDDAEIDELGFEDTIDGLALIEWPIRMGEKLPKYRLDIQLEFTNEGRTATLSAHGEDWNARLANF